MLLEAQVESTPRIDPDPWTLISLGVSSVAMFGTLAQVALAWKQNPPKEKLFKHPDPVPMRELLREAVESAIKDCEKLMRFIGKLADQPQDPLSEPFQFGQTTLLLELHALAEFDRLGTSLAHDVAMVHQTVMLMLKHHPEEAAKIGGVILEEVTDLKARVNGYFSGEHSNEQVLGDCIFILRTFVALLGRLETN